MTTVAQINDNLIYLATEAYMAGLDDGQILKFTPGDKAKGVLPKITKIDGSVPRYIPQFKLGDSNAVIARHITSVICAFHAFREARDQGKKPLV